MKKKYWVDSTIFTPFNYPSHINQGNPCRPYNTRYRVGDVVYVKDENAVGVVLGCIDEVCGDLRTDISGMVCYDNIEFYNPRKHPTAHLTSLLKQWL